MACHATVPSAEVRTIVTRIQAVFGQPLQIPANCALLPAQDLMSACREAGLEIHGRQLDRLMLELGYHKTLDSARRWFYAPAFSANGSHHTVKAPL